MSHSFVLVSVLSCLTVMPVAQKLLKTLTDDTDVQMTDLNSLVKVQPVSFLASLRSVHASCRSILCVVLTCDFGRSLQSHSVC